MITPEFERFVLKEVLPAFCERHEKDSNGFQEESIRRVSEFDATWFMKAIDSKTVRLDSGLFFAAKSGASEQIFWHGLTRIIPQPLTIWVEPVITIGGAGRLHTEFGWPTRQIGLQSKGNWAFDLVTYDEAGAVNIACEVKKSRFEIDFLLNAMKSYLRIAPLEQEPASAKDRNAYRKVVGLRKFRPKVFWALGPEGYGQAFVYTGQGIEAHSLDILTFKE